VIPDNSILVPTEMASIETVNVECVIVNITFDKVSDRLPSSEIDRHIVFDVQVGHSYSARIKHGHLAS
jgi:hypothetical protein